MNSKKVEQLKVGGGVRAIPFSFIRVQIWIHLRQEHFVVELMEKASSALQLAHPSL